VVEWVECTASQGNRPAAAQVAREQAAEEGHRARRVLKRSLHVALHVTHGRPPWTFNSREFFAVPTHGWGSPG